MHLCASVYVCFSSFHSHVTFFSFVSIFHIFFFFTKKAIRILLYVASTRHRHRDSNMKAMNVAITARASKVCGGHAFRVYQYPVQRLRQLRQDLLTHSPWKTSRKVIYRELGPSESWTFNYIPRPGSAPPCHYCSMKNHRSIYEGALFLEAAVMGDIIFISKRGEGDSFSARASLVTWQREWDENEKQALFRCQNKSWGEFISSDAPEWEETLCTTYFLSFFSSLYSIPTPYSFLVLNTLRIQSSHACV